MDTKKFTLGVERLINPINVGSLHFMQAFNNYLPKSLQKKLIKASAQKIPFMGFVVEPYAQFLCYEIVDFEQAKALLQEDFELVKVKIFDKDEPKYYCIFGCFTAHTSAFWGSRVEFYIIAKDNRTNLVSWIIVDYDSNTISYDDKNGLKSPNSKDAVVASNYNGTVYVNIPRDDGSRTIEFQTNVKNGVWTPLDQPLWLDGNLSIGYGQVLSDGNNAVFSLKFDPNEVLEGLRIEQKDFLLTQNTWYPGLFAERPSEVLTFPFAQHFVSDSPGHSSNIVNKEQLIQQVESTDFTKTQVISSQQFKNMFLIGMAASAVISVGLLIALLVK